MGYVSIFLKQAQDPFKLLQQPLSLTAHQQLVQQARRGAAFKQAASELAEDGEVEAAVGEVQAEQILSVYAGADRFGGLSVGEGFAELQGGYPGQPPQRQSRLADVRVKVGKVFILKDDAGLGPRSQVGVALGKGGTGNAAGFVWNGANGRRLNGHGTPPAIGSSCPSHHGVSCGDGRR